MINICFKVHNSRNGIIKYLHPNILIRLLVNNIQNIFLNINIFYNIGLKLLKHPDKVTRKILKNSRAENHLKHKLANLFTI